MTKYIRNAYSVQEDMISFYFWKPLSSKQIICQEHHLQFFVWKLPFILKYRIMYIHQLKQKIIECDGTYNLSQNIDNFFRIDNIPIYDILQSAYIYSYTRAHWKNIYMQKV